MVALRAAVLVVWKVTSMVERRADWLGLETVAAMAVSKAGQRVGQLAAQMAVLWEGETVDETVAM